MTEADADAYLEQHGIAADLPSYNDHGVRGPSKRVRQEKSVSLFSPASEVDAPAGLILSGDFSGMSVRFPWFALAAVVRDVGNLGDLLACL